MSSASSASAEERDRYADFPQLLLFFCDPMRWFLFLFYVRPHIAPQHHPPAAQTFGRDRLDFVEPGAIWGGGQWYLRLFTTLFDLYCFVAAASCIMHGQLKIVGVLDICLQACIMEEHMFI